jgi:hypothetical protein
MSSLFDVMNGEKTRLCLMNVDLKDIMRSLNCPALKRLNAKNKVERKFQTFFETIRAMQTVLVLKIHSDQESEKSVLR